MNRLDAAFLKAHRIDALTLQGGFCHYCLEPLHPKKVTSDHRVPRHKGGLDRRENIVAACRPCNSAKGSMDEKVFFAVLRSETVPDRGWGLQLSWMRRRIWVRTHLACRRVSASVGSRYGGPKSSR